MAFNKTILFLGTLVIVNTSCIYSQRVQKQISICLDKNKSNTEYGINTNGYFNTYTLQTLGIYNPETKMYDYSHGKLDTVYWQFILYPNGMCINLINFSTRDEGVGYKSSLDSLEPFLLNISNDKEKREKYYERSRWGVYSVKNDTLNIQNMDNGNNLFSTYNAGETYYKIVDSSRLIRLGSRHFARKDVIWINKNKQPEATFVPFESIPTSEQSWLYTKKWIWCK